VGLFRRDGTYICYYLFHFTLVDIESEGAENKVPERKINMSESETVSEIRISGAITQAVDSAIKALAEEFPNADPTQLEKAFLNSLQEVHDTMKSTGDISKYLVSTKNRV
jgi:hypothetical protein